MLPFTPTKATSNGDPMKAALRFASFVFFTAITIALIKDYKEFS